MSEPTQQNVNRSPVGPEEEGGSFGSWLRRQREMREITLREISETSKISRRYLEALEQDRFSILPAPVFAKGFLREYAKYVGLDPDEVVNYYLLAATEPEEHSEEPVRRASGSAHWTYGFTLALVSLLLFGLAWGLSYFAERRSVDERPPPPMAPPIVEPAVPSIEHQEVPSTAPLRVTLDFTQNCQVVAEIDDGKKKINR